MEYRKIRLCLVFFCGWFLGGCGDSDKPDGPEVLYENGRAVAVTFPAYKPVNDYRIYVHPQTKTPVLGYLTESEGMATFIPAIPFTAGNRYVIRVNTDSIAAFTVEDRLTDPSVPELLALYPSRDTVPENLLKCYLQFSQPMQGSGKALDFISVTDDSTGEEADIFLDLEAELWNREHDLLTLWLDPGRIKTDLIPNRTLGMPLKAGSSYTITVSGKWRSAKGVELPHAYRKKIQVISGDHQRPDPMQWTIQPPNAGSGEPLHIDFKEPLDAMLALEAINLKNEKGEWVPGTMELGRSNEEMTFTPDSLWVAGTYTLVIDPRLEDLAGNNVNRLFDRDITDASEDVEPIEEVERPFSIVH